MSRSVRQIRCCINNLSQADAKSLHAGRGSEGRLSWNAALHFAHNSYTFVHLAPIQSYTTMKSTGSSSWCCTCRCVTFFRRCTSQLQKQKKTQIHHPFQWPYREPVHTSRQVTTLRHHDRRVDLDTCLVVRSGSSHSRLRAAAVYPLFVFRRRLALQ